MLKRTLLLNGDYTPLTFLHEKRVLKFLAVDKVEILSIWDDKISVFNTEINFPATLKLKNQIKRCFRPLTYSRNELIKRDERKCQFCSRHLRYEEITIDHLVPRALGGKTNFLNCVVSCKICNTFKGSKTLEQSGLKLIRQPFHPTNYKCDPFFDRVPSWHEDWNFYYK